MLDSASKQLVNTFKDLTVNLTAVEQNVSSSLSSELRTSTDRDMNRLNSLVDSVRINTIEPGRQQVQAELQALRDAQEDRRNATLGRASKWAASKWGRNDDWWTAKMAEGGPYVAVVKKSAQFVFFLLLVGAAVPSLPFGPTDGGGGAATALWRAAFTSGMGAYLYALATLTQSG